MPTLSFPPVAYTSLFPFPQAFLEGRAVLLLEVLGEGYGFGNLQLCPAQCVWGHIKTWSNLGTNVLWSSQVACWGS